MQSLVNISKKPQFLLIFFALFVRILATIPYNLSHPTDIHTFAAWGFLLHNYGLSYFYYLPHFTDYPPAYMYILLVLENIRNIFDINFLSSAHIFILKTPAILADVITTIVIYTIAKKYSLKNPPKTFDFAFVMGLLYAFNPAVILNSAIWGQVDSIHTLVMVVSIYFLSINKLFVSVLIFAVSILIKPQSFMFSPLYLFAFYNFIFKNAKFDGKRLLNLLGYGIICMIIIVLLSLPFINFSSLPDNILHLPIIRQYIDTFGTYPFLSHNAYNIYALLGFNIAPLSFNLELMGYAFLAVITLASFVLLWRCEDKSKFLFVGAFLVLSTFMLSVRMHERYNFPAIALLLLTFCINKNKKLLYLYIGISIFATLNYVDVLRMSLNNFDWAIISYSARIFALPNIILYVYLLYISTTLYAKLPIKLNLSIFKKYKDILLCGAITALYATFAFTNLGNTYSPQSSFKANAGYEVIVDFGDVVQISRFQYMLGSVDNRLFSLQFSLDFEDWSEPIHINAVSVFAWYFMDFGAEGYTRYAKITVLSDNFHMLEVGFRDYSLNLHPINIISTHGQELFDEQHMVPLQPRDFMHSTHFDEIYHPRTAYEFLHGRYVFEWTHPPLGKVIMSLGINLFGMTPFGWRFMGTLLGVLMLPLLYLFAKKIFNSSFWASFATILFAFDFMLFAQTRLATIDTYIVFFSIGMYYFMYKYTTMNFFKDKLSKTLYPLLFSGIFMGLAIASKWQGLYGAVGLAVILFLSFCVRYKELAKAKASSNKIYSTGYYDNYWKNIKITCFACVGFFVVIPLVIYILSYIPFYIAGGSDHLSSLDLGFFEHIIQNQIDMYQYHAFLVAEHPFSSTWYQWILNYRPIFYFANTIEGNIRQGISSFGNPVLWWGGIVALAYTIYRWISTKDTIALFLIIGYFAYILPWVFVYRLAFIYHYFPNVPFLALMVAYSLKNTTLFEHNIINQFVSRKGFAIWTAVSAFALFLLFYPVLSGMPVHINYVDTWLRWLSSWVLMI